MTDLPPLVVRALEPGDEADWRQLWTGYLDFYESSVSEEVYQTTFSRLLGDDPQDFHALIAVQNGQPVGLAHYLFHRHCWRVENVVYLQDLFVDPDCRGTGAGRALIEALYDIADRRGTGSVYWLTQDFNEAARKLYDRVATVTPFIKYQR
ncbi:MAG: GNAT family N-acetyltransferase [Hyphomonadaceae bacterium]|nr:GNAT family N-acetyltransferase [Hyphomonadaceae bacterium]